MILAVVFVACSSQQDEDTANAESVQYETLRRDMAAMLNEDPDSAFVVLDTLESVGSYPECVIISSEVTCMAR